MSTPNPTPSPEFVSRGGLKLRHALDAFALDASGLVCADFGCSTGGFTHCLLLAGAARVVAIDTAYGQLAWKLRNDPRVLVLERTNALHAPLPSEFAGRGGVDLVVADMSWTPQRLVVPAALRWLGPHGRIVTLIKPHYELSDRDRSARRVGVLAEEDAERIARERAEAMPPLGARVLGLTRSPILGGATGTNKSKGTGNPEWLALLEKAQKG